MGGGGVQEEVSDMAYTSALIVGAGAGLSASLARAFAKEGMAVALAARAPDKLARLAESIGARTFECDAAQRYDVEAVFQALDDDKLMPQAREMARRLAAGPTKGYALIKKALQASSGNSLDAQLDLERDLQREAGLSGDYREGVSAFKEKRAPAFKGK